VSIDQTARMGEWVVSTEAAGVLSCIGLGSCIGLALLDRRAGVAGLAHVMLPEAPTNGPVKSPGKYADLAVPALLEAMQQAGATRTRLEAALVGGAQMFSFGKSDGNPAREIGIRNAAAVKEQLAAARVRIKATATGGGKGRSMKVYVGTGEVTVKEAAGTVDVLVAGLALAA
jgi:chemotaxis protein CheD